MYGFLICLSLIFTESVIFGLPTSRILSVQAETGSLLQKQLLPRLHNPNETTPEFLHKRIVDKKDVATVVTKFCKFCQQPSYEKSQDCTYYCMPSTRGKKKVIQLKQTEKDNPNGGGEQKVITVLGDTICAFCKQFPEHELTDLCQKKICSKSSLPSLSTLQALTKQN
ncbi:uncharacterized protein LOC133174282 [Saccostrea echinata]|uniref:uncharacterized protein LOC133174282 n=1 Tax=Saccostrea echinata TaxID=191078 RepID=UPI002A818F47|nr:uncharacterized protein LOC133174282 [Saccostrea echinata]